MVNAREADGPLEKALLLMRQALVLLDSEEELDVVAARLQEVIDTALDHQSNSDR